MLKMYYLKNVTQINRQAMAFSCDHGSCKEPETFVGLKKGIVYGDTIDFFNKKPLVIAI